jgi:hypothetical protein
VAERAWGSGNRRVLHESHQKVVLGLHIFVENLCRYLLHFDTESLFALKQLLHAPGHTGVKYFDMFQGIRIFFWKSRRKIWTDITRDRIKYAPVREGNFSILWNRDSPRHCQFILTKLKKSVVAPSPHFPSASAGIAMDKLIKAVVANRLRFIIPSLCVRTSSRRRRGAPSTQRHDRYAIFALALVTRITLGCFF